MGNMIKCLVWDLDDTLWKGTLLEGDKVVLRSNITAILKELQQRGVLNSIASRNDEQKALSVLKCLGVDQYFLTPRINYRDKPENLRLIARDLNLSINSLAFIDNDPFEREAVKFSCPSVKVLDAEIYQEILSMPEFNPGVHTDESRLRAQTYKIESIRRKAEREHNGTRLDFLNSCEMNLRFRDVQDSDFVRIAELSVRTNKFNSSGISYSMDHINELARDPKVRLMVAELKDRFGDYGKIGAMVLRISDSVCCVESLMVSCRVDGRGVPSAMLIQAIDIAKRSGLCSVQADFTESRFNRRLGILYGMLGFTQVFYEPYSEHKAWSYDLLQQTVPEMPEWLTISIPVEEIKL